MTKMRAICDTWNIIEKYGVKGWKQADSVTILIPDSEYERVHKAVANKKYIENLRRAER